MMRITIEIPGMFILPKHVEEFMSNTIKMTDRVVGGLYMINFRRNAPVRSGKLKESLKLKRRGWIRKGKVFRSSFDVTASTVRKGREVKYADFVEDGTRPSPGHYIPVLDRRRVNPRIGIHPGVWGGAAFTPRKKHFVLHTRDRVFDEITKRTILERIVSYNFNRMIKKYGTAVIKT